MSKIFGCIILSGALLFSVGCDAAKYLKVAEEKEKAIIDAMDTADPIVSMLENSIPQYKGMRQPGSPDHVL